MQQVYLHAIRRVIVEQYIVKSKEGNMMTNCSISKNIFPWYKVSRCRPHVLLLVRL